MRSLFTVNRRLKRKEIENTRLRDTVRRIDAIRLVPLQRWMIDVNCDNYSLRYCIVVCKLCK